VIFNVKRILGIEEPTKIKIPIKFPDDSISDVVMPMQLPLDILKYLLTECGLCIDDRTVSAYWQHLDSVGEPVAMKTKGFREAASMPVWPLGLYGDDCVMGLVTSPYSKMLGIFMSLPLYRPTSVRMSRYLIFSIEVDKIVSVTETLYPVFERIVASVNELVESGINGRQFLLTEIRGDQSFFRMIFRYRSWWKHRNICYKCCATTDQNPVNYLLYNTDNGWESTVRSTEQFILEELELPMCSLAV